MAITAGNGNTALRSKGERVQRLKPITEDAAVLLQSRLQMTQSLQTSLDLRTILETFFSELQSLVNVGGMIYEEQDSNYIARVGSDAAPKTNAHKINYRLTSTSENLGEITFSRRRRFNEAEMAQLENLLAALIFPLRNSLLYREALISSMRDALTGIGNRKALDQSLAREIRLARRYEQPLSMLVIDADHFKRINDNHGHNGGDQVLKQLASTIACVARDTDLCYRYGGEEFVILLNKTELAGAEASAARLRDKIARKHIILGETTLHLTVSIGIAAWCSDESPEQFFRRADGALYRAKELGRDRVVVAD